MTQHMIVSTRTVWGNGVRQTHRTACGRWVTPANATSWQQTTCRACRASRAWGEVSGE